MKVSWLVWPHPHLTSSLIDADILPAPSPLAPPQPRASGSGQTSISRHPYLGHNAHGPEAPGPQDPRTTILLLLVLVLVLRLLLLLLLLVLLL